MFGKPLTGWHVLAIFCTGFAVIIAVNLTLAFNAVATFPGLEVKNSYVASQSFDADRAAQEALGWDVSTTLSDGVLTLRFDGDHGPVRPEILSAVLGRATHVGEDRTPDFQWTGTAFSAPVLLGSGNWNLRLEALAENGTVFKQRIAIRVPR